MKAARFVAVCLFSLMLLGVITGVATAYTDRFSADGVVPVVQRLWTTNSQGSAEIDTFSIGDEVWLKTADGFTGLAVNPGNYRIYVFTGNLFVASPPEGDIVFTGKPISTLLPVAPTVDVTVGSDGVLPLTKIWSYATPGCFTVVLDQLGSSSPGTWDDDDDYRDDLCMGTPTPPSFCVPPGNVVPEVGTIVISAAMFGSLGLFLVVKRRKHQSLAE